MMHQNVCSVNNFNVIDKLVEFSLIEDIVNNRLVRVWPSRMMVSSVNASEALNDQLRALCLKEYPFGSGSWVGFRLKSFQSSSRLPAENKVFVWFVSANVTKASVSNSNVLEYNNR